MTFAPWSTRVACCPAAFLPKRSERLDDGRRGRYIGPVGLTSVRLQVANFAVPDVAEDVVLLVDSGAIYSVVPGEILARLGLAPRREREFRLANATCIVRGCGVALFRYGDRDAVAEVIFGETGDAALLGAFTLEALGLCLDPLKRELLPIPMILAAVVTAGPKLMTAARAGAHPRAAGRARCP